MKKSLAIFFLLCATAFYGQNNQLWGSYFSYNSVVAMAESPSRMYAASESAMFYQNVLTSELKTITSVDGLKAESITAIYHSDTYNRTLVGNSNGLLLVINQDNSVITKIDIVQETTIPSNIKRINHIDEYNGKAYLSCDFGIAVIDLTTLEFGDSYYIGPGGSKIKIYQTAVVNNHIYAAAGQNGLYSADLANPNLVDYNQWSVFHQGNCLCVANHNDGLVVTQDNAILRYVNNNFIAIAAGSSNFNDLRSVGIYLVATSVTDVFVFNIAFIQGAHITSIPGHPVTFAASTVINNKLYIGTKEEGVLATFLNNQMTYDKIVPDGPERSKIFSLEMTPSFLWVAYGEYTATFNPNPLDYFGISKLTYQGWVTIPNSELDNAASIVDIVAAPNSSNKIYAASYHSGLLEIEDDELQHLYNNTNTGSNGLESLVDPGNASTVSVRINSLAFDGDGNLWMTNSRLEKPLKELKAGGQWVSYDFSNISDNSLGDDYSEIVIDRNDTKWIASRLNGVIAFNEKLSNKAIVINQENGNLPDNGVRALAIDHDDRLWIGTTKGLRVISNVGRFTTENSLSSNSIIIEEDGVAQELMYEQTITDIEVDGSNNKWLATTAGAFLVSPDGQKTIYHFTKENSPLPSNIIYDIAINPSTGEVFFATDKGMVSYKGTSTAAADDLSKVYVYPNPVRPGFNGDVKISGLIDDANIKITDIEGNLVYETTSEGGTVLWDTTAFGKYKVASGVYMIFISSDDGMETKVKKVMIIR